MANYNKITIIIMFVSVAIGVVRGAGGGTTRGRWRFGDAGAVPIERADDGGLSRDACAITRIMVLNVIIDVISTFIFILFHLIIVKYSER